MLICLLFSLSAVVVLGSTGDDDDTGELDGDVSTQKEGADDYNDYGGDDETENAGAGGAGGSVAAAGAGPGAGSKPAKGNANAIRRHVGVTYLWGKWDKWSKCNNTCVQIKRRQCIRRVQNDTESEPVHSVFYPTTNAAAGRPGCYGTLQRYRLCKDERCRRPDAAAAMRDEQCAAFKTFIYKERYHKWLGHVHDADECQLHCRPSSAWDEPGDYVRMNRSVTNGTPCKRPAVYYTSAFRRNAVCVDGVCRRFAGPICPADNGDGLVVLSLCAIRFRSCGSWLLPLVPLVPLVEASAGAHHAWAQIAILLFCAIGVLLGATLYHLRFLRRSLSSAALNANLKALSSDDFQVSRRRLAMAR